MDRETMVMVMDPFGVPHEIESNEVYIDHDTGGLYILVAGEGPDGEWFERRREVKFIDPHDTEAEA